MKNNSFTILLYLFFFTVYQARATSFMVTPPEPAVCGSTVTIDVETTDFNSVISFQFTMIFDPAELEFNTASNNAILGSDLTIDDLRASSGEIEVIYSKYADTSLPDEASVFQITFNTVDMTGNGTIEIINTASLPLEVGYYNFSTAIPAVSSANLCYGEDIAGTCICVRLPVELDDFYLDAGNQEVGLHWSTLQEINNEIFIVERSKDGENFTAIGSVPVKGKSEDRQTYFFKDIAPHFGYNYYRLKQIDADDSFSYSPVRTLYFEYEENVVLFPNPGNTTLNIFVAGFVKNKKVRIYDALGVLRKETIVTTDNMAIDIQDLPEGAYYLIFDNKLGRSFVIAR